MFDFGSMLGSGTVFAQRHRAGNEYILERKPGLLTLLTLGLYTRPWMHIDYPDDTPPAVGRLEADRVRPGQVEARVPESRLRQHARRRRLLGGADRRHVRRRRDSRRRREGALQRSAATDYITDMLMKRREKVLRQWLTAVNPVVDVALGDTGALTFANAAERAGVATPAEAYSVQWARFDNATGAATAVGTASPAAAMTAAAPAGLVDGARDGDYIQVAIGARHAEHPSWATPVTAHFRRAAGRWTLVGLRRLP